MASKYKRTKLKDINEKYFQLINVLYYFFLIIVCNQFSTLFMIV